MIIIAMIIGTNGIAVSQSSGDIVTVTRVVNGSSTASDVAQYLPGDNFVVQLNYAVTGKPYAVTIAESLPDGWTVVDSNVDYTYNATAKAYVWNISSPLTGVASGTILYLVKIPDSAVAGPYYIGGGAGWYSTISDIRDGTFTGEAETAPLPTLISVDTAEGNGPCSWIYAPAEEIGDGDGHLENGEWATYRFFVRDEDGISGYTLKVNGVICTNYTLDIDTANYVEGTAHAKVTHQNGLLNVFSIEATDSGGVSSVFALPLYVPWYDYTAWAKGEFNGWSVQAASFEPSSSLADGGWIVLDGGTPVRIPALETHYSGPAINKAEFSAVSDLPFASRFGLGGISGSGGAIVNVTPRSSVQMPMATYPIYMDPDSASATFYGTPDMNSLTFHVVLVGTGGITMPITMNDIVNAVDQADICANATGDFRITSAQLPGLATLSEGYYAIVVLDYNVPNVPCLVAAAPIVVTKTDLAVTRVSPDLPMPGDPITYTLDMASTTPGQEYMYLMAMVPEKDYRAALNITSDGTIAGTELEFNGLTVNEHVTVNPATKTVTIVGINGTYTLDPSTVHSITGMQDIFMNEFSAVNVSMANSSLTTLGTVDLTLPTKATMPVGKYIVLSVALESSTGRIAAINQTTVDLGMTTDIPLYKGWNLISLPVKPANASLFAVFTPDVMANVTVIWGYNSTNTSSPWQYYTTLGDPYIQGNLSEVNETLGYWVLCKNNTTLRVSGTIPDTSAVTLNHDWNLVGNPTINVRNVRDVYTTSFVVWEFEGLDQTYDYWCSDADNPGSIYIQGTLTTLKPGYGYWVLIS